MNQVSSKLRRGESAYFHWCPGCNEMHPLPDGWQFDGNLEKPTFSPSFKHDGWVGGKIGVCHYLLIKGKLHFQNDCTHDLNSKVVELPDLPEGCID